MNESEVCEVCGEPLDERPWQRSLEGTGAHCECLEVVEMEDDE